MARANNGGQLPTIGTILGVLMLSLPGTSVADPVALSYNIIVNQCCQESGGAVG